MPYRSTSHYHALLTELVRRGGRVTYAQLLARYGLTHHFDGFAHAVWKARQRGLVKPALCGAFIEATEDATCPCCGRKIV